MTHEHSHSDSGRLRIWYRDDIKNALLSAYAATLATSSRQLPSQESLSFRRGFVAALVAVGLNFGIAPLPFAAEWNQLRTSDDLESVVKANATTHDSTT
ncbi:MAG: hypothetical protein FJY85_25385 [Deltaproteobacteria bacterium]|nr:hypothetical protein [Deltaproteobacteria bacterium]